MFFFEKIERNYIYHQRILLHGLNEENKKYVTQVNPFIYLQYLDQNISRPLYIYENITQDIIDSYYYSLSVLPAFDQEDFDVEVDDESISTEQKEQNKILFNSFFERIYQLYNGDLMKIQQLIRYILASNYENMVTNKIFSKFSRYDEHIEKFEKHADKIEILMEQFCTDSEYFAYHINTFELFNYSLLQGTILKDRKQFYENDSFIPKRRILRKYDPFFKDKERLVKNSD